MTHASVNTQYVDPGETFMRRYGPPRELEDVLRYARWIREEANVSTDISLDLAVVYVHFHMPKPGRAPLPGQQGLLLNSDIGLILVNQDDPFMRQRFTEAHELMELLFDAGAQAINRGRANVSEEMLRRKEHWCDEGAAELLIPHVAVVSRIGRLGVSFHTARYLAEEFQVSLTASLWQMVKASDSPHAIVRWRMKHKPSELTRVENSRMQGTLFGEPEELPPKKRLRVEWSVGNSARIFIPSDKSIEEDTAVYSAWRDGIFTNGADVLDLGHRAIRFKSENQPFELKGERQVLSLLTLSG